MTKTALSEIQVTMDVIGGKWKPLILCYLEHAPKRHSQVDVPLTNQEWYDLYLAAGYKLP
ncbi:hypothetical protein [Limosilactobacillus sp.]|uniref:winged helix-turn-helix transcriptional regulator n=1 Tax=Limosilactobacillus sp. TaxID=2773925 RepID=UPI0035A084AE